MEYVRTYYLGLLSGWKRGRERTTDGEVLYIGIVLHRIVFGVAFFWCTGLGWAWDCEGAFATLLNS